MPRTRKDKHRRAPVKEIVDMFAHSDGVTGDLDGQPVYENRIVAHAAWQAHRAATWRLVAERGGPWLPHAAQTYDGIAVECLVLDLDTAPSKAITEAAERDLASVDAFGQGQPR